MLTLIVLGAANVNAQVTIGADRNPATSAVLDLEGTKGALLLPRADTLSITSPTAGMQVYRPADKKVYVYDGTRWKTAAADVNPADLAGIPGTIKAVTHLRVDTTFAVNPNRYYLNYTLPKPVDPNKTYTIFGRAIDMNDGHKTIPCWGYLDAAYTVQFNTELPLGKSRYLFQITIIELY
ncbi:hypothetical protein FACS189428_5260 [Clostridia bacterium]|nr:hypothetical protein FACS189428_5260 [Clostridia bacterium]